MKKKSIKPLPEIAVSKIKLRSQPIENLTLDAVETMIKDKGFFDLRTNKLRMGFPHKYEVQKAGKVVYDHVSGLMWQQSGSEDFMTYDKAKDYIRQLNKGWLGFADYRGWRLPTLEEAMSLMETTKMNGDLYIDPKFGNQQHWIWTSDLFSASRAWVVYFEVGSCDDTDFSFIGGCVRAVR